MSETTGNPESPYFEGEDEEDREPVYGEPFADENPMLWAKSVAAGAETIQEAAEAYREAAEWLTQMAEEGWVLSQPEDNGHLYLHWAGEGAPPKNHRARITRS